MSEGILVGEWQLVVSAKVLTGIVLNLFASLDPGGIEPRIRPRVAPSPSLQRHDSFGVPKIGIAILLASLMFVAITPSPAYAAPPVLDGSCSGNGTTTASCALTATGTSDLIIVELVGYKSGGGPAFTTPTCTGTGCPSAFSARITSANTGGSPKAAVAEYYGTATAALSAVTVSEPNNGDTATLIIVGAFSGVSSTPFSGITAAATVGSGTVPSNTLTATLTDTTLLGLEGDQSASPESVGTGFTSVNTATRAAVGTGAMEYQQVAADCSAACTISFGASVTQWALVVDAIQSTTSVPEFPYGILVVAIPTVAVYFLLRRRQKAASPSPGGSYGSKPLRFLELQSVCTNPVRGGVPEPYVSRVSLR